MKEANSSITFCINCKRYFRNQGWLNKLFGFAIISLGRDCLSDKINYESNKKMWESCLKNSGSCSDYQAVREVKPNA